MTTKFLYEVIVTDTLAGELNYSWARKAIIETTSKDSVTAVVRRAKKAVGYNGVRMVKEIEGIYRVPGACVVMTIEFQGEKND